MREKQEINWNLISANEVFNHKLYINETTPVFNSLGHLYGYYAGVEHDFIKVLNENKITKVPTCISYFKVIQTVI